ncbi:transcriptional activator protein Pur-alpha [Platysternon megacephalum]|uniref:Transcriptional activator protein Pur-alpha n=1 Tax=Platysternon megacephalum TaxID=55544 RepID=A0A4D9F2M4_9SAUR|nr:transcriptional activator protein Pur-alpha [Platysternon megacephalum]
MTDAPIRSLLIDGELHLLLLVPQYLLNPQGPSALSQCCSPQMVHDTNTDYGKQLRERQWPSNSSYRVAAGVGYWLGCYSNCCQGNLRVLLLLLLQLLLLEASRRQCLSGTPKQPPAKASPDSTQNLTSFACCILMPLVSGGSSEPQSNPHPKPYKSLLKAA